MSLNPSPSFCFHTRGMHLVHELPYRIRLKSKFLRHPMINSDYLEASLLSLPGVEFVRINPRAGSLIIRHNGSPKMKSSIIATLATMPSAAFVPGSVKPREIHRVDLGLHLLVVAVSCVTSPLVGLGLALLTGLPVVVAGINNLIFRGFTAQSLDALSVALCLAVRNYTTVCVIAFMRLFGDYLKQINDKRSNELLHGLLRLSKQVVWVERESVEMTMSLDEVAIGDVVVCGPGELVAVDGKVLSGSALVNKSMITGESIPVTWEEGDSAISGSVVENGRIRIKAEKVGADTALSKIHDFLDKSLQDKSLPEIKGDAMANRLAPVTLGLGVGTYLLTGDLSRSASVASIDYVCSVKFPARLSVRSSMLAAAKAGVLLKGGRALDALARIDTVVFDKTGTLTTRNLRITDVISTGGWTQDEVLTLAARMEQHYDHPVARTILAKARRAKLPLSPVGEVDFYISHGICALVDGKKSQVGSRRFISNVKGVISAHADALADTLRAQGKMALYVVQSNFVQGVIGLQDEIRAHAQSGLSELRTLGIKNVVVLTGDHRKTAQRFMSQLEGVDAIHWELNPEDKARVVNEFKQQGHCVAVVGDGVNDAPALVSADLGICMAHSGELVQASAQAVVLNNDLRSLCAARRIATRQHRILHHCLYEGATVNTLLLGLATTGILSPLSAAVLHNLNTFSLMGYAMTRAGSFKNI